MNGLTPSQPATLKLVYLPAQTFLAIGWQFAVFME
jgi:hypothetical protein